MNAVREAPSPAPEDTSVDVLRWVRALSELADEVNRVDDVSAFLDRAAQICAELSGCDFALLRLDRPEPLVGHYGLTPEYYALLSESISKPPLGTYWSAIEEALTTGQPSTVPDFRTDPRLEYWRANADRAGIRSYASFPLVSQIGCIGVLNIYYKEVHSYSQAEVGVVRALAGYAAVAIESAALRRDKEVQLLALRDSLERRSLVDQLHRAMTSVALSRLGAPGTLAALTEVLGASSVFEDISGRIMATSSPDESRAEIRWIIEGAARRESSEGALVPSQRVGDGPSSGRQLYRAPVVVDTKNVGVVWMLVDERIDEELAQQGIEYASIALALELSGRAMEEANRDRVFEDLVAELLQATTDDQAALAQEKAVRLGHPLDAPIGMAIGGDPFARQGAENARRLVSRLRRRAASMPGGPLISRRGSVLVAIWSGATEHGSLDGDGTATSIRDFIDAFAEGTGSTVVICAPSADILSVSRSWATGLKLLKLASRGGSVARVVDARRTGLAELLLESSDPERLLQFRDATLGPLLDYDAAHRSNLLETLEVTIAEDFRTKEAARALVVHPNTLVYRLHRVTEILGLDPHRSSDLLSIELALAVHRIL